MRIAHARRGLSYYVYAFLVERRLLIGNVPRRLFLLISILGHLEKTLNRNE